MLGSNGQQRGRAAVCPAMQIGEDIVINMGLEAGDDEWVLAGDYLGEVGLHAF